MALACSLLALLACGSKPGPNALAKIREALAQSQQPEITVHLDRTVEEMATARDSILRQTLETLANSMGFRVEVAKGCSGFLSTTRYTVAGFAPGTTLPGLSFTTDGQLVRIRPDFRREVIVESVLSPKEGFESIPTTPVDPTTRFTKAILAKADNPGAHEALAKIEGKERESQAKAALAFVENVERARKDRGAKHAWVVSYRVRQTTALPADSPFWNLAANVGRIQATNVLERSLGFQGTSGFWAARGKEDVRSTLALHAVVVFEGMDGAVTTEACTAFRGE